MSMLPALDESEKKVNHGWSSSTLFGMDTIATSQEGSQNIYQHLINQNNTGTVPDAVVEEEILPRNGQTQAFQVSNPMSTQRFPGNQVKQQLVNAIHSPHQVVNQSSVHQERISQYDPQRSQHSYIPPQNTAAGGTQKVKYVIRPPAPTNQLNTTVHGQQKMQSIIQTGSENPLQEDILDQAIKMQNQQIAENQKMLEHYKRLGFQTSGNSLQSPQVPTSASSPANFTVKTMNTMNNSPSVQNNLDIKMVHSGSATNQAKSVLQLNPTGIVNRPRAPTQPNTFVHQGYRQEIVHNNKRGGGGNIRQQHNPVQVSMVSSNQVQSNRFNSNLLNNVSKKNVILEGGGEFEEGQAYVIRNKEGKSQTMLWKNGDFVPLENTIIQHQVVDSSQRGKVSRGRGGRGRGRGQGQRQNHIQGNNMGNRAPSPRGGMRMQFSPPRLNHPNSNVRGPNSVVRHNVPQVNHVRPRQPNVVTPSTIVIQTPLHQTVQSQPGTSQALVTGRQESALGQPAQTGQMDLQVQQGSVLGKVDIKNLMPAAQGSQKILQSSGTNLARDHINQEDKEVSDKDLTQYLSTSLPADSQGGKTEVLDPPRIPSDPNAVAVCQFCGYISEDKVKCESCKRKFTSATKYQVKGTGAPIVEDSGQKKRKIDFGEKIITLSKKAFYGKKPQEQQNQFYHQVIKSANGSVTTITYPSPRIIVRGSRSRGRGRGRGRGMVIPETITLSSDEEEGGEGHHRGSGDANTSSQSKSSSVGDSSSQQDPPESPLIPNIPISSSKGGNRCRREKMEDEAGLTQSDREKSLSPVNVLLNARSITVGTFRGIPIEPIVLCTNGLRFFMEGPQSSHRFTILPNEIQQCLAHFSKGSFSYLFFLVNKNCGIRTRKDLGIKFHCDLAKPPPEPYFDPFGADLTHQMITVIMEKVEATIIVEFQKYMDLFKSWGKAGDEAFFMELTEQEADEVRKQSLSALGHSVTYPSQSTGADQQYSQHGEDGRSRSPSPPRLGFVGPIIKLLTYPPPPEKRGISITNEDLYCLQEGEFLNDVIIDFYLKYLHLEKLNERDRERTHIFSSFFYKRLTQRIRGAAIDDDPSLPLPVKRHARVKTWTRHVDLFKKDFIIIPINEHAHWFLAIICYPWMIEPAHNRYIPNRSTPPMLDPDSLNIPTPPQPTDENADELDEDTENPNPLTDQQSEGPETSRVSETPTTTANNSQSIETEQASQPSQEQNETQEGNTTDTENTDKQEKMEVEQKEDPLQTDSEKTDIEPMDTSEKSSDEVPEESQKSQDEVEKGSDEVNKETCQEAGESQNPSVTRKLAQVSQKLQNIRPIRGQPVEEGDNTPEEDVMVGVKQPCILIFDSLSGPSRSRIVTVLKEYLQVEWQAKKAEEFERSLNKAAIRGCVPKVPQQNNYSDCGVFMLQYVESFFEDPIQDFATPMKGLHDWFSLQKIEGKREWLKDLIISLKEKYESKSDSVDNT